MFNIGFTEVLLLLAIALIIVGPKKLPGIAHSLGKALREFKGATRDFKDAFEAEADSSKNPTPQLKKLHAETRWPEEETDDCLVKEEPSLPQEGETPENQETSAPNGKKEAGHAG